MIENPPGQTRNGFPPAGSCDCHVHVIGRKARYLLAEIRSYTPVDAPIDALRAMMARIGVDRAVLIQTSIFGTDNSCLLDALGETAEALRGVAFPADDASASELDAMHALGVRGIRLNTVSVGTPPLDKLRSELKRAAAQCARQGWHLQIFALPAIIEAMAPTLSHLPVPIVFDHFGMVRPERIESEAVRSRHRGARPPFRGRQSGAGRLGQRLAAHATA